MKLSVFDDTRAMAMKFRCFLDGEDVTDRCFAADDEAGWADLYEMNADGRKFSSNGLDLASIRKYGRVELVEK